MEHHDQSISTGNLQLDAILDGGLTPNRIYLLDGDPGTGKTTLGLKFLMDGVERGESSLYVTLSETKPELEGVAASHGWSLKGIHIHELVDPTSSLNVESQYTMFQPSEVELAETTQALLDQVEKLNPK